jgi:hypothetical protein
VHEIGSKFFSYIKNPTERGKEAVRRWYNNCVSCFYPVFLGFAAMYAMISSVDSANIYSQCEAFIMNPGFWIDTLGSRSPGHSKLEN